MSECMHCKDLASVSCPRTLLSSPSLSCAGDACTFGLVQMRLQQSAEEDIQKLLAAALGDKAKSREDLVRTQGPKETTE